MIPGNPDIAITKYKIAVFCDGEFFHGKDWEVLRPKLRNSNNGEFWISKISRNRERDDEVNKQLLYKGYTLFLILQYGKEVDKVQIKRNVQKWFVLSTLTGRYISSPESKMDQDLRRIGEKGFLAFLQETEGKFYAFSDYQE